LIPIRDIHSSARRIRPVVNVLLIAINVLVFFFELSLGPRLEGFLMSAAYIPARGGGVAAGVTSALVSMFLHGGWGHLLGNMLFLWIFANRVEDRMGRIVFPIFYLVGGVAAGMTHVLVDPTSDVPAVGASGAISAVMGAYVVLYPRARIQSLVFLGFFYQLIDVPAIIVLGFWFVLQLIDGLTSLGAIQSGGGVAFFAHIGGFVVGAVMARIVLLVSARRHRPTAPPTPSAPPAVG
jgi:membrane associated rhomboid family serine protease